MYYLSEKSEERLKTKLSITLCYSAVMDKLFVKNSHIPGPLKQAKILILSYIKKAILTR